MAKADRDAVLAQGSGSGSTDTETRSKSSLRLLAYDGTTARVDMAATAYVNGQTITISMVYDLIWEDGDWHLSVPNPTSPIDVAPNPGHDRLHRLGGIKDMACEGGRSRILGVRPTRGGEVAGWLGR